MFTPVRAEVLLTRSHAHLGKTASVFTLPAHVPRQSQRTLKTTRKQTQTLSIWTLSGWRDWNVGACGWI